MSVPFYVSPEQLIKDKADYARKGIARGRSVVALAYSGGMGLHSVVRFRWNGDGVELIGNIG